MKHLPGVPCPGRGGARTRAAVALLPLLLLACASARAQEPRDADPYFLRAEAAVFGAPLGGYPGRLGAAPAAAGALRQPAAARQVPGEFGTGPERRPQEQDEPGGPSQLGRKVKAGALSAVLPGAGQYYNGRHDKAYVMAGVEAAIWTAYFVFDDQGDNRMATAREFAGIYAGASGEHPEEYWQSVGRFMDSDAYNEARLREARALQEEPSGLIPEADAWQWVNLDRLQAYQTLRADGNSAYDRRDFMILFAVVNRAVSVVDAVMGVRTDEPALQARVLGLDLQVGLQGTAADPAARCSLAGRF